MALEIVEGKKVVELKIKEEEAGFGDGVKVKIEGQGSIKKSDQGGGN